MNKYAVYAVQAFICLISICFAFINASNTAVVKFLPNAASIAGNTAVLIIFVFSAGLAAGFCQMFINKHFYKSQIEFYARKNEKLSQANEIETDTKEVLQRRIAALEIALADALKKKDK